MSEKESCPIMQLPDEILSFIMSHITDIPLKMSLEQVCKRFQFISSSLSISWHGVDRLEIIFTSQETGIARYYLETPHLVIKFRADDRQFVNDLNAISLNGYRIALQKWPAAIAQLLCRTVIHQLWLHVDWVMPADINFLLKSFSAIQTNAARMKLNYVEFHHGAASFNDGDKIFNKNIADDLFLWAIKESQKTLETIVLLNADGFRCPQIRTGICNAIEKCERLTSFSYDSSSLGSETLPWNTLVKALRGKPLNNLTIGQSAASMPHIHMERVLSYKDVQWPAHVPTIEMAILPICEVSTGISSLSLIKIYDSMDLKSFASNLSLRSRESLEEMTIEHICFQSFNSYLPQLEQVPFIFPNLNTLHLEFHKVELYPQPLNEDLFLSTNFFNACNGTIDVDRKVVVGDLIVKEKVEFKERLIAACEEQQIITVFGDEVGESWVTMTKENASIELRRVENSRL